jgi:hypothetical protein
MNFLRKLFGGDSRSQADADGIYFYVQCDRCGEKVRLRAHKVHDLNRTDDGFVWHKTIVDSRCFRPMPTVVHLDFHYHVINQEIQGGRYISEAEYHQAPDVPEEPSE